MRATRKLDVYYEEALPGIAPPEALEGVDHLQQPLASAEQAAETVGMPVMEAQELFGAFEPVIGGPHPWGPSAVRPGDAAHGLEFQGPDAFFFRSKAGSREVFQVRMRWARRPSRRSIRSDPPAGGPTGPAGAGRAAFARWPRIPRSCAGGDIPGWPPSSTPHRPAGGGVGAESG